MERKSPLPRITPLQNRALSGQYPPGSLFKIIVALAGLEEGVIDPDEEIICNGSYFLGDQKYRCWKKGGHGSVKLHRALRESCDVYFYKIGMRLGINKIAYYARKFGPWINYRLGHGGRERGVDSERGMENEAVRSSMAGG